MRFMANGRGGKDSAAASSSSSSISPGLSAISGPVTILLLSSLIMVSVVAIPVADEAAAAATAAPPAGTVVGKKSTMTSPQHKVKLNSTADFDTHLNSFKEDKRKLAILLDFDGTLAPITQHPKDTVITPDGDTYLRKLIERKDIFTAIISGRGLPDLKDKITVEGITRAGNHGLEIKYPDGQIYNYPIPEELQRNYTLILQELGEQVAHSNAWVEDKRVSITFHYREAPAELQEELRLKATEIIKSHGYRANQAHFAVEAKPPVEWNKGFAAEFILETTFGKNWRDTVKVVVAGDDVTDEDAMRKLKGQGATFRVTHEDSIETDADFLLESPYDVAQLLKWITENM